MPDKSTAQVYLEQAQGRLKELGEILTKATPGGPYENDVWATMRSLEANLTSVGLELDKVAPPPSITQRRGRQSAGGG